MRYSINFVTLILSITLLFGISITHASAQPVSRVAIFEPAPEMNFNDPRAATQFGNCPTTKANGAQECKIYKVLLCETHCEEVINPGSSGVLKSPEEHARQVSRAALELTTDVEVILLLGPNVGDKRQWIIDNAVNYNITAVNHSAGRAVCGTTYPQNTPNSSTYDQFISINQISMVISSGNNECNGFSPTEPYNMTSPPPYVPKGTFALNPDAELNNTIAVGAGFEFTSDSFCHGYLEDNNQGIATLPLRDIELMCMGNAPDNPDTASNFYVAFGCHVGFDPKDNDSGKHCGTSFAAPRVAGGIAQLRSQYPTYTFSDVVNHLDNVGSTKESEGHEMRQYKSLNSATDFQPVGCAVVGQEEAFFDIRVEIPEDSSLGRKIVTLTDQTCPSAEVTGGRNWRVSWGNDDLIWGDGQTHTIVHLFPIGATVDPNDIPDGHLYFHTQHADDDITTARLQVYLTNGMTLTKTKNIEDVTTASTCAINSNSSSCIPMQWINTASALTIAPPAPDILTASTGACVAQNVVVHANSSNDGSFYAHEFSYADNTPGWNSLGRKRTNTRSFAAPDDIVITIRSRSLASKGWTAWAYETVQTQSCGGGGFLF